MKRRAAIGMLVAAGTAALMAACAKPSMPDPPDPHHDLVVLLPDSDNGGGVGRATVGNKAGSVTLSSERHATTIAADAAPRDPYALAEAEVERLFGRALAALPPAPLSFTLFFQFDSEELTAESRTIARKVLARVKKRASPEVAVFGHTDTTGARDRNIELGLKRANAVRKLLIDTGVDPRAITVSSHGEAELLVYTGDNVFEPRNRRVEVTVR